jgi:hypothetical protein
MGHRSAGVAIARASDPLVFGAEANDHTVALLNFGFGRASAPWIGAAVA